MKKWQIAIIISVALASFFADKYAALLISNNKNFVLDSMFTLIINYFSASFFLALLFAYILIKKRDMLKPYMASVLSSAVITVFIKYIIVRPRPFMALPIERLDGISYAFDSWNASFPSWHTVSLFLILPFVDKKYKNYWLAIAIIIAASRLYSNMHYLSDVLFGALLGYLISKIAIKYLH